MFLLLISSIFSTISAAPIELQSNVTLPPAIAVNLDAYSLLHYRLGALMSDLDQLIYAEDGAVTPEELKRLVKETYETTDKALEDRIVHLDEDLKYSAGNLTMKGVKVDAINEIKGEKLEELQHRIVKAREDLLEIDEDENNMEEMKKKYKIDGEILSSMKGLHLELKKLIQDGYFDKDIKKSMKILLARGPFGTALV